MNQDFDSIQLLRDLKARIVTSNGLWSFFDVPQAFEKELMVAQTISAAVINYDQHGEPFSIKGNVNSSMANSESYHWLCGQGYFQEAKRMVDGKSQSVIFPTDKLLKKLRLHFSIKG
jgi:hypothetical protein